ncbi:tetratricopeptide repeat protein [Streptomyces sp. NPDC058739]|uniref:tetratricopeptide repeat protein n=1 Tax=Streptomyces sp. NPDC058739 TaxID=3346618 RepID=UPI0036B3AA8F
MFSRRNPRPKTPDVLKAWELLDSDDVPGALRQLRSDTDSLPLGEVALVVARAAEAAGFDDLRQAASELAARPALAKAQYAYGYACVERGVSYLAVPALREVLRANPDALGVMRELVSAYEREGRHADAAELLGRYEDRFVPWPDRYLLVYNALMAGDLTLARRQHALLGDPEDAQWLPPRRRQTRMLERAAATTTPLDLADLRGWQYVIGGTILGTLSPYGFEAGMTGRFAFLQDTPEQCLRGLLRLRTLSAAAGLRPRSVSLLPDRDSRILGLAAARVLGLPAKPFAPGREHTVVVAYDLNGLLDTPEGPEILQQLHERAPGQVLHEHASCWTDAPAVTADSVTLLHQSVVAPWGERMAVCEDGTPRRGPADERPEERIAEEIAAAEAVADEGDGGTPADPDETFAGFASAVRDTWLRGERTALRSSGPVPSGRFL